MSELKCKKGCTGGHFLKMTIENRVIDKYDTIVTEEERFHGMAIQYRCLNCLGPATWKEDEDENQR